MYKSRNEQTAITKLKGSSQADFGHFFLYNYTLRHRPLLKPMLRERRFVDM